MKTLILVFVLLIIAPHVFAAQDNDYLHQGNVSLASGKLEKAVRSFEQAVKADPQSAEAYKGLGMAYYRLGDNAYAVNTEMLYKSVYALNNAVEIKPDAESYYYIGVIWLALDDKDSAGKVYGILKDIDRQKSEELAEKIAGYKEPESYRYLDNEHSRAEEQKDAARELARQQRQQEIGKQQEINAKDRARRAEDAADKARKARNRVDSLPTGGHVVPGSGGQIIQY